MCVTNWLYVICVSRTLLSSTLYIVWVSRYECHELGVCDMCVTNSTIIYSLYSVGV